MLTPTVIGVPAEYYITPSNQLRTCVDLRDAHTGKLVDVLNNSPAAARAANALIDGTAKLDTHRPLGCRISPVFAHRETAM